MLTSEKVLSVTRFSSRWNGSGIGRGVLVGEWGEASDSRVVGCYHLCVNIDRDHEDGR